MPNQVKPLFLGLSINHLDYEMSESSEKYPISISQSPGWHLQIAFIVTSTVYIP